ncbi:hypothetical protein ACGFW5_31135 [Streptomyces sp. NPDC048416]|uniref:hypothetical protein n=1 Tax=Streptomyces sp. NPDC048416 TaxID=3365546 RepID=UPI00371E1F57
MGRTVPVAVTESPGNYNTSALFNAQVAALNSFLTAPPIFFGYATTAQSIPGSNAMVGLNLDTELLDPDGGHSTVTNTSRYTPTVPGVYMVFGSVGWPNTTAGDRRLQIGFNGSGVVGSGSSFDPVNAVTSGMQCFGRVTANGTTDYIEVMAGQASGGAMNTTAGSIFTASMCVHWISR